MNIVILKQVEREFKKTPKDVLVDAYAMFDDLVSGKRIGMPHSRSLSSIARGLYELRLSYSDGIYRIFYIIKLQDGIYIKIFLKRKIKKLVNR